MRRGGRCGRSSDSIERQSRVCREDQAQYLAAGSPICCFLHSCRKPFLGTCVHGNDGHFYCSHECADEGEQAGLGQGRAVQAPQKVGDPWGMERRTAKLIPSACLRSCESWPRRSATATWITPRSFMTSFSQPAIR